MRGRWTRDVLATAGEADGRVDRTEDERTLGLNLKAVPP